ncbi:hypothetical protein D3C71_2015810 [compost metagenome]
MTTLRRVLAVIRTRHGRSINSMMMLAKIRRSVVVPWAPMSGNMLLANEAPDCIEAMAMSSRPIGKSVAARLRGWLFISARRSLSGCG